MSGALLFFALWAGLFQGAAYSVFHDGYRADRTPNTKSTIAFIFWLMLFVLTISLAYFAGRYA